MNRCRQKGYTIVLLANSDLLDTLRVEGFPFPHQLLRYWLFWQRRGIAFAAVRPFRWRCLLFGANSYANVTASSSFGQLFRRRTGFRSIVRSHSSELVDNPRRYSFDEHGAERWLRKRRRRR